MPLINEIVKEVNSLSKESLKGEFYKFEKFVKERDEATEGLPELPNVKKKVVLRIAPFPSGALHLGNAKTFILNALYAEKYNGELILVMDDTIGSEKKPIDNESYKLIKDGLKWLGIKTEETIYKSDRLEVYYEYARKLIEKEAAYVCHCTQEELKVNRAQGKDCSCRVFPKGVQIIRWEEMFNMKEGHAVLRLKTDMKHPNPAFRDRVLFKISDREHPRVGTKYRIWPTLEMSWAIDDYLLKITYIIRGNDLMIESDVERFIWEIFKWKGPEIIHTGIVNIEGAGISKSKSRSEVRSGEFKGWDDPRTWSLQSLARRGIKPLALKSFVEEIGLNKQNITVPIEGLYAHNRRLIDSSSDRYSFIVKPVELNIDKVPKGIEIVSVPIHPDKKKERKINIGRVFISFEDFEALRGKEARLLHLYNILISQDIDGLSLFSSMALKKIPKINWVSDNLRARVLMPDGSYVEGIAEIAVKNLKVGDVIQFERFGFVKFDGIVDSNYDDRASDSKKDNASVGSGAGEMPLDNGVMGRGAGRGGKVYEFWFAHK